MFASDGRYNGPVYCANVLNKYREMEKDILILDVGAGTGLVGTQVRQSQIDISKIYKSMIFVSG